MSCIVPRLNRDKMDFYPAYQPEKLLNISIQRFMEEKTKILSMLQNLKREHYQGQYLSLSAKCRLSVSVDRTVGKLGRY